MKQLLSLFLTAILSSSAVAQQAAKHTVYFENDQSIIINTEAKKLLDFVKAIEEIALKLEVVGHTDFRGSIEYNQILSEKRANAVMAFIETKTDLKYLMSLASSEGEKFADQTDPESKGVSVDRKVEVLVILSPRKETIQKPIEEVKKEPIQETDLLVEAEVGQTVVLKNLNFFPGRHYLVPQALPELERLVQIMSDNPTLEIEIQGHICCKLDSVDALDVNTKTYSLSFNRAEYIFQQLVLAGIEETRISYRGFAGSRPLIQPELTEMDRNRNRRVEIKILKK